MARGRRAKPAEIKQLMGNPGKRRLALAQDGGGSSAPVRSRRAKIEVPAFLDEEEEKFYFNKMLEWLPANLVRPSDAIALGRWATWLHLWISCKHHLKGKNHFYQSQSKYGKNGKNGVLIFRKHPVSEKMSDAENKLMALEDRLCLNIVARSNVMHKLMHMPPLPVGATDDLFEEPPPATTINDPPLENAPLPDGDPLGFVQRASKDRLN